MMSDMDDACVATAFASKPAPLFSELATFIFFLNFVRGELQFLGTTFMFASGYRFRYLSSKIEYASFFLTVAIYTLDLTSHKAGSDL
jgi:hypothetical protein